MSRTIRKSTRGQSATNVQTRVSFGFSWLLCVDEPTLSAGRIRYKENSRKHR